MAKCPKPSKPKIKVRKPKKLSKAGGGKNKKRHSHGGPFLLYHVEMFQKYRGNMYCSAKVAAKRWNGGKVDKCKYTNKLAAIRKRCPRCCKKQLTRTGTGGNSRTSTLNAISVILKQNKFKNYENLLCKSTMFQSFIECQKINSQAIMFS